MIGIGTRVRVLVATKPVDFRKGADRLPALAKETLGTELMVVNCIDRAKSKPGYARLMGGR